MKRVGESPTLRDSNLTETCTMPIKPKPLDIDLEPFIKWELVLKLPRRASGHEEIMKGIFGDAEKAIAWHCDNDYQGECAVAHKVGRGVAVFTDYFGSCSGCDSWEDADDDSVSLQVLALVKAAKVFSSAARAADWLEALDVKEEPQHFSLRSAKMLIPQLRAV